MIKERYCLSKVCRQVVICFNFVVRDVFVLSLELMRFWMERWRIAMAREENYRYWRPYLVSMRSAFSISEVNSSSISLIWVKLLEVVEFVVSLV